MALRCSKGFLRAFHGQRVFVNVCSRTRTTQLSSNFLKNGLSRQSSLLRHHLYIQSRFLSNKGKATNISKDGKEIPVGQIFRNIWSHIPRAEKPAILGKVVLALCLLGAAKTCNISVPCIFKMIIDHLNSKAEDLKKGITAENIYYTALGLVLMYAVARISAFGMQEIRNALSSRADQILIRVVTKWTFRHVQQMDMTFHTSKQMGSLMNTIDRGTRGVGQMFRSSMLNIFPTALEFTMVTGVLVYSFGLPYAGVVLGTCGVYGLFTFMYTNIRNRKLVEKNKNERATKDCAHDSFVNYESVKYFNNEEYESEKYDGLLKKLQKSNVEMSDSLAMLNLGQHVILSTGLGIIMALACGDIVSGAMTVGDLVMVNGLLFQLSVPLNFLGSSYRDTVNALTDVRELYSLMSRQADVTSKPGAPALHIPKHTAEIIFDNVHFAYQPGKQILNGLSFEVPAGKKVAVVGGSGCGKSTIVRLMYRFYDPLLGRILINGQDISQVDIESVRRSIAVVPQDCGLFNDTVFHNIHYGNLAASNEEVYAAAEMAEIHNVVQRFPLKYEQRVGDRGSKLSGGEKQRVAIARAYLKNAPIFLYDEATSSLDSVTEDNIMKTIKRETQYTTSIVIAHRLSTIVDADEILVLNQGHISERGNHYELLRDNSTLYAHLWNKQHDKALRATSESTDIESETRADTELL